MRLRPTTTSGARDERHSPGAEQSERPPTRLIYGNDTPPILYSTTARAQTRPAVVSVHSRFWPVRVRFDDVGSRPAPPVHGGAHRPKELVLSGVEGPVLAPPCRLPCATSGGYGKLLSGPTGGRPGCAPSMPTHLAFGLSVVEYGQCRTDVSFGCDTGRPDLRSLGGSLFCPHSWLTSHKSRSLLCEF